MKNKQQQYGQFFTEYNLIDDIIKIFNEKNIEIKGNCLEPSFGDGAFIDKFKQFDLKIDAYEIDSTIFKNKYNEENITLYNNDFIDTEIDKKYDFIVGNPPYIELAYSFYGAEIKDKINKDYQHLCDGRLNLTHIFIYKCLNLLKDDGILAFLLPSSILTSPYYNKIRKLIHKKCDIIYLKNDVKFKNVAIKVSLLIIKKTNNITNNHILEYGDNIYLCENCKDFPTNIITLKDEGFKVNIGEIVWNKHKNILSDIKGDDYKTLIYSTFIKNDNLEIKKIKNDEKKTYIKWNNIKYNNCLVIPRTISSKIKFFLVEDNKDFIFENHILVVTNNDINKLIRFYNKLKSGDYDKYINLYFNSSNLSAEELLNLPYKEINSVVKK